MKWEIELNQNGIGTVKCDGVDIAKDLVGCHMTTTPGKGVILYLELRTGAKFTLDNPTVQYAHQEQLEVTDTDPNTYQTPDDVCIYCRDGIPHPDEDTGSNQTVSNSNVGGNVTQIQG